MFGYYLPRSRVLLLPVLRRGRHQYEREYEHDNEDAQDESSPDCATIHDAHRGCLVDDGSHKSCTVGSEYVYLRAAFTAYYPPPMIVLQNRLLPISPLNLDTSYEQGGWFKTNPPKNQAHNAAAHGRKPKRRKRNPTTKTKPTAERPPPFSSTRTEKKKRMDTVEVWF